MTTAKSCGPQKESFANRIRVAVRELATTHGEITTTMIANQAVLKTYQDSKRMANTLSDLFKAGELIRLRPGVYALNRKSGAKPELREVMWRIVRMRRAVTVEDLVEMAGAAAEYAREWLRMLAAKGIVRKEGGRTGVWRLIVDPVQMPEDDKNAEKLQRIRERKKKAMADLYKARTFIEDAIKGMAQNEAEEHE